MGSLLAAANGFNLQFDILLLQNPDYATVTPSTKLSNSVSNNGSHRPDKWSCACPELNDFSVGT